MAGPHEVLGMSRLLGISTTEFLALYADNGGTTLRFGEDGRCVFVTRGRVQGPFPAAAGLPSLSLGAGDGRRGGRAVRPLPEAGRLRGGVRDGRDDRGLPRVPGRRAVSRMVAPLRRALSAHAGDLRASRHPGQGRSAGRAPRGPARPTALPSPRGRTSTRRSPNTAPRRGSPCRPGSKSRSTSISGPCGNGSTASRAGSGRSPAIRKERKNDELRRTGHSGKDGLEGRAPGHRFGVQSAGRGHRGGLRAGLQLFHLGHGRQGLLAGDARGAQGDRRQGPAGPPGPGGVHLRPQQFHDRAAAPAGARRAPGSTTPTSSSWATSRGSRRGGSSTARCG